MSVQTSSIEGFVASKASRSKHEKAILTLLKAMGSASIGYNNRQIAAIIGQPINVVTPATLELRRKGLVTLAGRRKDVYSGVTTMFWRVPGSYTSLIDVPEGVTVKESAYGDVWQQSGGRTRMGTTVDGPWSSWATFSAVEDKYGPFNEVPVAAV